MIIKNIFLYHIGYELQKLFKVSKTCSPTDIYTSFNFITPPGISF